MGTCLKLGDIHEGALFCSDDGRSLLAPPMRDSVWARVPPSLRTIAGRRAGCQRRPADLRTVLDLTTGVHTVRKEIKRRLACINYRLRKTLSISGLLFYYLK